MGKWEATGVWTGSRLPSGARGETVNKDIPVTGCRICEDLLVAERTVFLRTWVLDLAEVNS